MRLAKTPHIPPAPPSIDLSVISSSTVVVPELLNLTHEDLEFIEAIINRAGPLATTFPLVFKAYNDVLKERGMDGDEVKYYGKLLKLGTMKGKNWGEKWEAVKKYHPQIQQRPQNNAGTASSRVKSRLKLAQEALTPVLPRLRDIDADTIPSDLDNEDHIADIPQYHETSNVFPSKRHSGMTRISETQNKQTQNKQTKISMISSLRGLPASMRDPLPSDTSLSEADTIAPYTPTPNGFTSKEGQSRPQARSITLTSTRKSLTTRSTPLSSTRFSGIRHNHVHHRDQDSTDEDDAWNKIRAQQLEAEADRFREERLLGRCWAVWSDSYQWIMASRIQIDQARNTFLLRLAFYHWRNSLASRRAIYSEVAVLDNERRICTFLALWRRKLREKQQTKWRADMRNKMNLIKDRQNARLLGKAWNLWTQKYQFALADQQYGSKLLLMAYIKWKEIFKRVDKIEGRAEHLIAIRDERLLLNCWEAWRAVTILTSAEKELTMRVQARIKWQAWSTWRKYTYNNRKADFFRDRCLKKRFFVRWQAGVQRIGALVARADKHSARRDKILACAILRVWIAHVRGKEMDRQRDQKLLYCSFLAWKKAVIQNRQREELATVFHQKTSIRVVSTTLNHWRRACKSHHEAYEAAARFYDAHLLKKTGHAWLSRFREAVEDRKRQKLVKKLQDRQAARILYRWLVATRKRRRCIQAELLVQEQVRQRTGRNVLSHWTQRVIFMRERELNAIETYSLKLERDAWSRLKSVYLRHRDNLKLLEDHLALKEEDILRRFFQRWKNVAHMAQHRRYVLQKKEDENKKKSASKSEIEMLMRSQQNLMYQAFSVWHAKARTKPAIIAVKFNAQHTKKKFYIKWREALPIAQKVRKVREKHENIILGRSFHQWLEAYRAKLVMKAVARARYLRLPTNGARGTSGPSPPFITPSSSASPPHESTPISSTKPYPIRPRGSFMSRRSTEQVPSNEEPTRDDNKAMNDHEGASPAGGRSRSSRLSRSPFGLGQGIGIVSLLRTNVHHNQQGKSDLSPPRPRFPFSGMTRSRRGSSINGAESRATAGPSLFASALAESTPPNHRSRSIASDDVIGRRAQWSRLGASRRVREPSPSGTSQSSAFSSP
ncbi:hypothetical protein NP233_g2079 [Leucocoprinus birnbaumii]|uniref:Sfi1 spindle body domain-containing protein n=1 Tax=Leucocoprinus birnbaumii TaxID=56174 RepID=A0AAD5YU60_9AGAR|nr:hypothetical protein NP233_g2079 [Leucocoprinus birnbaumii]